MADLVNGRWKYAIGDSLVRDVKGWKCVKTWSDRHVVIGMVCGAAYCIGECGEPIECKEGFVVHHPSHELAMDALENYLRRHDAVCSDSFKIKDHFDDTPDDPSPNLSGTTRTKDEAIPIVDEVPSQVFYNPKTLPTLLEDLSAAMRASCQRLKAHCDVCQLDLVKDEAKAFLAMYEAHRVLGSLRGRDVTQ